MIILILQVLLLIIVNVYLKELMMVLPILNVLLLMMLVNVKYVNLVILKINKVCVNLYKLIFVLQIFIHMINLVLIYSMVN